MIILPSTTDKLQVITGSAVTVDVIAHYAEVNQASPPAVTTFNRQPTAITTATTTDVLSAPAASTTRNLEEMSIRNKHASLQVAVTVQYNANGTLYEIYKVTLNPGDTLEYIKGIGWFPLSGSQPQLSNFNTTDSVTTAGTDTYLAGGSIVIQPNRPIALGTMFVWRLVGTKSAAGIAAWAFNIRFGTAGAVADTARLTFTTTLAQTAVVDSAIFNVYALVRGPIGASCVVVGGLSFEHHLAITGFSTQADDTIQVTSGAFDCTTAGMIVGLSSNPGASGVFTFQVVSVQAFNL